MRKTLIALAVPAAPAGAAHAQSGLTLYGIVNTGFIRETGSDLRMGGHEDSHIGFKGVEDPGSGLKATFELEYKFGLNDGALDDEYHFDDRADWQGAAHAGLAGHWGAVRFGRVNDLRSKVSGSPIPSTSTASPRPCRKRRYTPNRYPIRSVTTARPCTVSASAPAIRRVRATRTTGKPD